MWANLAMELPLIDTHRLKYRVLELEELQLQSLLEATTHVLFLMMQLSVVGEPMVMADLGMERLLNETHLLKYRVLELEELR